VKRAILLQTDLTKAKRAVLSTFETAVVVETNRLLGLRNKYSNSKAFWNGVHANSKKTSGFINGTVGDIIRGVWSKQEGCEYVNGVTVKFNVKRTSTKTFSMKKFFFIELALYPKRRIAIPILKNRNFERFMGHLGGGWTCKTFGLTPSLEIVAYLSKPAAPLRAKRNVLGIDINAKDFAYTVLTPEGKILKQGYLGQHIWPKKHHFMERRALLQSLNALKKLKRMRHRQRDFVRTNVGQMVREIILLAKRFDADISIERLSRFKPKGRSFNRKAMTIPFYLFRRILEGRCFDDGITLNRVDAYHTSKWCIRCGAVGAGHDGGNYALFRCKACGLVMNSDRKASVAVAVKTFLERNNSLNQEEFQISGRRVPVSGLLRVSDAAEPMAVPLVVRSRGNLKATRL
jgi:IS605 OrfB family transposase